MYYEFEEPAEKLAGHRILALNRGEKEKFLTVKVQTGRRNPALSGKESDRERKSIYNGSIKRDGG